MTNKSWFLIECSFLKILKLFNVTLTYHLALFDRKLENLDLKARINFLSFENRENTRK